MANPLSSLAAYSQRIVEVLDRSLFVTPNLPRILQEIESLLVASLDTDLWNDAI